MRVILILLFICAVSFIAAVRVRKKDEMAGNILFVFSGFAAIGFIGAFFDLF